jgi:hypothetical protein
VRIKDESDLPTPNEAMTGDVGKEYGFLTTATSSQNIHIKALREALAGMK